MLTFRNLVRISRPRFWMYTLWPVLIAFATSWWAEQYVFLYRPRTSAGFLLFAFVLFFVLFPSNLLIYWVNDIADYETDVNNKRKKWYEHLLPEKFQWMLAQTIIFRNGSSLLILSCFLRYLSTTEWFIFHKATLWAYLWFIFFATSYSLPPIRAKSIPFVDGLFNILYILPWVAVYIALVWFDSLNVSYVLAWWLRCIAMHAYSAIPDIEPDSTVWITTTAVFLWKKWTLLYCGALWTMAAFLVEWPLGIYAYLFWAVYMFLLFLSWYGDVSRVYKVFPRVNAVIGFFLFWYIIWYG